MVLPVLYRSGLFFDEFLTQMSRGLPIKLFVSRPTITFFRYCEPMLLVQLLLIALCQYTLQFSFPLSTVAKLIVSFYKQFDGRLLGPIA